MYGVRATFTEKMMLKEQKSGSHFTQKPLRHEMVRLQTCEQVGDLVVDRAHMRVGNGRPEGLNVRLHSYAPPSS